MIASAMGERTEFRVQQNRTLAGRFSITRLPNSTAYMEDADQGEQPPRRVEVDLDFVL